MTEGAETLERAWGGVVVGRGGGAAVVERTMEGEF